MPCLEVTMPTANDEIKNRLARELTAAFAEATPFPSEIFGIVFHEYAYGNAASGGAICTEVDARPYLHLLLYCPRLKRTAKQAVVRNLTTTFCSAIGHEEWQPVIHICEHPYDNVGVEGQLLSDSFEQCRKAEFYYALPEG